MVSSILEKHQICTGSHVFLSSWAALAAAALYLGGAPLSHETDLYGSVMRGPAFTMSRDLCFKQGLVTLEYLLGGR